MEIAEGNWKRAVAAADELSRKTFQRVWPPALQKLLILRLTVWTAGAIAMMPQRLIFRCRVGSIRIMGGWRPSDSQTLSMGSAARWSTSAQIAIARRQRPLLIAIPLRTGRQLSRLPKRASSIPALFWRSFGRKACFDRSQNLSPARAGCCN